MPAFFLSAAPQACHSGSICGPWLAPVHAGAEKKGRREEMKVGGREGGRGGIFKFQTRERERQREEERKRGGKDNRKKAKTTLSMFFIFS